MFPLKAQPFLWHFQKWLFQYPATQNSPVLTKFSAAFRVKQLERAVQQGWLIKAANVSQTGRRLGKDRLSSRNSQQPGHFVCIYLAYLSRLAWATPSHGNVSYIYYLKVCFKVPCIGIENIAQYSANLQGEASALHWLVSHASVSSQAIAGFPQICFIWRETSNTTRNTQTKLSLWLLEAPVLNQMPYALPISNTRCPSVLMQQKEMLVCKWTEVAALVRQNAHGVKITHEHNFRPMIINTYHYWIHQPI